MAPKKNYTAEQMAQALQSIANGVPIAAVAKQTGIPRTTLIYKSTGKSPKVCTIGPSTVLTSQEETFLSEWILSLQRQHFPVTKTMLMDSVEKIILQDGRATPFTNNRPGEKWFKSFLRRHPDISSRVVQNLTPARESVTEQQIRNWFFEIKEYLISKDLFEVANDPKRVFNADESAFYLNPKGNKVLARKGDKNIYSVGGDEKENLTVLVTANAEGKIAPPMVVFTYTRVPGYISASIPPSWAIGNSENGWMCSSTFYEYITNIFVPWLNKEKIERPIIFYVDGHVSHLTLHLSNFCTENGIELISLFPNSTHLLQPMDVAVFRPLKNGWRNEAQKWRSENGGLKLQKQHFGLVFAKALESINDIIIQHGFRVSGLCPFEVENVKFEKIGHTRATTTYINKESKINSKVFMKELESYISTDTLKNFDACFLKEHRNWSGNIEDTTLFNIWKKVKIELSDDTEKNKENNTQDNKKDTAVGTLSENTEDNNTQDNKKDTGVSASTKLNILTDSNSHNSQNENEKTPLKDMAQQRHNNGKTDSINKKIPSPLKNVPTPFKKALFWPEASTSTKKRKCKEKIPSVVTSQAWRDYKSKKENEKKRKLEEKEQRKLKREENKKQKIEKKKKTVEPETSSDEEWEESEGSSVDVDIFEQNEDFCDLDPVESLSIGDHVLVKFVGGKRNTTSYRYVCVIQTLFDDNEIEVMSLKLLNNEDKTLFRIDENDISTVNSSALLGKLPTPAILTSGDRIKYKFVKPVDVYEAS